MTRYAGDGAGDLATGGDKAAIDPKHKAPSTRIPAVVLAVNNNAMSFSNWTNSGDPRRRVIFNFSEVVGERNAIQCWRKK